MSKNEKVRIDQLDLLKAAAIFLVVFYHSYSAKDLDIVASGTFVANFNYCLMGVLGISVPLFFTVNGYLLLSGKLDLKKLAYKILKLVLLTGVWGILNIVALMLWRGERLGPLEIVRTLWRLQEGWVSHFWFLGSLGVVYIFYPLIKTAFDNNKKAFTFFFAVAFVCTFGNKLLNMAEDVVRWFLLGSCRPVDEIRNYFNIFNAMQGINGFAIVYFMWGGILAGKRKEAVEKQEHSSLGESAKPDLKKKLWAAGILFVSVVLLDGYAYLKAMGCGNWYDIVWYGYDSVFIFIGMTAFYVCTLDYRKRGLTGRCVAFLSRNSLGIYVMHIMLLEGIKPILDRFDGIANIAARLAACSVALLASGLFSELLSRIPGIRRLTRL